MRIGFSAQAFLSDGYAATFEIASTYVQQGAQHVILVMPAEQGPEGIRRLSQEVAEALRAQFG